MDNTPYIYIIDTLKKADPSLFDSKLYKRRDCPTDKEQIKKEREMRQSAYKNITEKIRYMRDENLFKVEAIITEIHQSNRYKYEPGNLDDHDGFGGNISTGRSWGS